MPDEAAKTEKVMKKNGGRRPGAGRKKGVPNKATFELKKAAQEYSVTALETLVAVMIDEDAYPSDRVKAAQAILDRGHGRPVQSIEGTGEGGAISLQIITGVPRGGDDEAPKD